MNRFEAVIFDMDGLLLDSERLELQAFNLACDQFELGAQVKVFERCVGANSELRDRTLKEGFEGAVDFRKFRDVWEAEYAIITHKRVIPLKAGAIDLLNAMRSKGMPVAVATSSSSDHAHSKLKSSGIYHYFDSIVGGDQVSESKPSPEIYLKAAQELGVLPVYCMALEDSPNGVRAAVSAGMTVVQIPDLVQPDEELLKLGHIVLGSLAAVLSYPF